MDKTHLDHVVIAVSDWERSNAFYREVVGVDLASSMLEFISYS